MEVTTAEACRQHTLGSSALGALSRTPVVVLDRLDLPACNNEPNPDVRQDAFTDLDSIWRTPVVLLERLNMAACGQDTEPNFRKGGTTNSER
ncbi:unnamed protein product [Ixodes persulcatus]